MIICGLKLTHDGAVALVDGDELIFSIEMEKLDNDPRYSPVADLRIVAELLTEFGYRVCDVDEWVIDGWNGRESGHVSLLNHGVPVDLVVAPYREAERIRGRLPVAHRGRFRIGADELEYSSHLHVAGHLAAAYCTSPFAAAGEPALVLVWDGGTFPRIYHVAPDGAVESSGALFRLVGGAYPTAAHHFGPYRRDDEPGTVVDLSVAGKLMAYIALGKVQREIVDVLREQFHERFESAAPAAVRYREEVGGWGIPFDPSLRYLHAWFRAVRERTAGFPAEDVLASVHQFLEDLLVEHVTSRILDWRGEGPWNLCFAGGSALNIKWNSALRALPVVGKMWVPPFPNDSGSAVGTACAHLLATSGTTALRWHPRLGPALRPTPLVPAGWRSAPCSVAELARVLHEEGEPVVVVNGRAELGPRALGARSILASATEPAMKDLLNRVKGRESFRPVAPVCLVEHAPEIFDPGSPDPHMLFDHRVRESWVHRVPAVLHIDGTARLQTVSHEDDPVLHAVLGEYHRLSGVPVLCNTSANHNGRGFFPDAGSAMEWGGLDAVWSEGVLHRRAGAPAPQGSDHA